MKNKNLSWVGALFVFALLLWCTAVTPGKVADPATYTCAVYSTFFSLLPPVIAIVLALLLFLTGVVFCYFAVYSLAVDFFLVAGDSLATPMLSIDKYVSFLFGFLVPFGVAFQLPVVLYLTTRVGLTTPDMLRSKRKYVILAIFVLAAILTPPDVVSQVALGLPMCGLYEIGILVSRCTKARERA